MKVILKNISIEFIKIRSSPIPYLVLGFALIVGILLYVHSSIDISDLSRVGTNPWNNYLQKGITIFSVFMVIPFLVLLVSAFIYIEQRADSHKFLYTLPSSRSKQYFSKLYSILILVFVAFLFTGTCILASGYILGKVYPEFEFYYYAPNYGVLASSMTHTFLASLGIIGLQYFLGIYSKQILVPIGVGFFGLVMGFVLFVTNSMLAQYFPYSYVISVLDLGLSNFAYRSIVAGSWLTNLEVYSMLIFLCFVTLGYFYETRRSIK